MLLSLYKLSFFTDFAGFPIINILSENVPFTILPALTTQLLPRLVPLGRLKVNDEELQKILSVNE